MRGSFLLGLVFASGSALAQEAAPPAPVDALPPALSDRVGLVESKLVPAERTTQTPPHWTGEPTEEELPSGWWLDNREREPAWVTERLAQNERFVQPLALPMADATIEARLVQAGGWNPDIDEGEVDQYLHLSLMYLEVYAPLLVLRDSASVDTGRFRLNLKLPYRIGASHVVAVHLGASLTTDGGPLTDDGGYTSMLAYAFGSDVFSVQARLGIGDDQMLGDFQAPLRSSVFYDLALAGIFGPVQAILQADGQRFIGASGNELRVWPGVRYFPLDRSTLSIGAGAQLWFQDADDDWTMRRAGGFVDLGWLFY